MSNTPQSTDQRVFRTVPDEPSLNDPFGSAGDIYRTGSVRFLLPGHYDSDLRITDSVPIMGLVDDIYEEVPNLDHLAFEVTPGTTQLEHFLTGYSSDNPHERAMKAAVGDGPGISDYGDTNSETVTEPERRTSPITKRMKKISENGTPDSIRTQECDLDVSPLGEIPVPTSRLLQPENMPFIPIENDRTLAVLELLETLTADNVPFIYQVLLKKASTNSAHDYLITARLAVFGTNGGIATKEELMNYSDRIDDDYRISTYFGGESTDNFALPIEAHADYAAKETTHPSLLEQVDDHSAIKTTVEDLKSGFAEYKALLGGVVNEYQHYRELFNAYGTISVTQSELANFVAIKPTYFDINPWGRSATANPVQIVVEGLGEQTPGTRQTYGTEKDGDTTTKADITDEESLEHQETLNDRVTFLVRQGYEILAVDQSWLDVDLDSPDPTENTVFDDESRPDIVARKDEQIYCEEIEIHNDSKPVKLLTNIARGAFHGYPVHVITADKSSAESKYLNKNNSDRKGPIYEVYKRPDESGVICYNLDDEVSPEEGVTMVLPSDLSESVWRLTPDGTAQLLGDGTVLAEGPADSSIDEFEFNTPRLRETGSECRLESASGEVIRTTSTREAALEGYTRIRKPFIPMKHHHLADATVMYQQGDGFTQLDYEPEWAKRYRSSASRRYEVSAEEFIRRLTLESDGASIAMSSMRREYLDWYQSLTDLNEPNDTWFGRAVSNMFDEFDNSSDHNKVLEDREFRFPSGIISPDLPFVHEEDLDAE